MRASRRILNAICECHWRYEISKTLEYRQHFVDTPLGVADTHVPSDYPVLGTIIRAGLPFHQGFLNVFDQADNAFIAAYRHTKKSGEFEIHKKYTNTPNLDDRVVIMADSYAGTVAVWSACILKKIAVVGPESTGKSTIAQAIARHFNTVCVPEYAREYCKNLKNEYTLQDEVNMYYGQIAMEVWCDYLFGNTPEEVKNEIRHRAYDLYLLMDIDLPWEDDPLRDFPNEREHFLAVWKKELDSLEARYSLISGLGEERLKNALKAIEEFG
ncbi:hypothetical protein FQR65_LT18011 [Abscondita terminalis]|nr:hypothetical protein FQR65_LT18011 [Abscondita terminalis]